MPVTSVLFDLYGTLLDVQVEQDTPVFWTSLASRLPLEDPERRAAELRSRYHSILEDERSRHPDGFVMDAVLERLLAGTKGPADEDEVREFGALFRSLSAEQLHLRPYAGPLLAALKDSGCKTAIVSNTEAILTRFDLSLFPVLQNVDAVVLSSEAGVKKPDAKIFHIALEMLGASSGSSVFIGDNFEEDILGARRAGLRAIYIGEGEENGETITGEPRILRALPNLRPIQEGLKLMGWGSAA